MAQREAPVSSTIKALQQKTQLSGSEEKSAPSAATADPGPESDEQLIADLEQENELLRKSAEQLIEKLKVQKATETDLHKQLSEALQREEKLMEENAALKKKLEQAGDANDVADLTEENELLRKSAEQMIARIQEMKNQLAALTTADAEKAKKIAALEAEKTKLKQQQQQQQSATAASAPAATTPASTASGTSKLAAAMSAFTKKPATTATPTSAPAPASTSSSGGNRFAALVKSAATASGVSSPTTSSPSPAPSGAGSKWGAALSGAVQTVRTTGGSTGPLQIDETVKRAYYEIRSDPPPITWALFAYAADGRSVTLAQSGAGGFAEMTQFFKPEDRCYAFVRVTTGDSMSNRAKFIFITWVGERVSPLKKARVSTDRMFMKDTIRDFALEIFANNVDELSETAIMAAVRRAGGADYGSSTN